MENIDECVEWVDAIISTALPDPVSHGAGFSLTGL